MEDKKVKARKLTLIIILMIYSFVSLAIGVFLIIRQSPNSDTRYLSQTSRLMFTTLMLGFNGGAFYTLGLSLLLKSKSQKESGQIGGSIEQAINPKSN
jgi:hypothetical protein